MAYIGNTPAENYVSIAAQHFTVSATTSYSLNRSVTNENELALFINNVRQQPGSSYSYTATGTTLTLSAATAVTDTMYCIFLGKSVGTIAPPDGSVGTSTLATGAVTADKIADGTVVAAEIADGAVTDAKISAVATTKLTGTVTNAQVADLDAAKLTGTVADARFPATLPASSGANLTGLTAGNITGVIPAANLGTGTANATTFLNGSGAYSEAGGGATALIARNTFTNASTIEITSGFDSSTYDSYLLMVDCYNISNSSSMMGIRTSSNGGSSFDSSTGNYRYGGNYSTTGSAHAGSYSNSAHNIPFNISNLTVQGFQLELVIVRPDITSNKTNLMVRSSHADASGYFVSFEVIGQRFSNGLVNGIQLMQWGSMLLTGTYQFIGYKKA